MGLRVPSTLFGLLHGLPMVLFGMDFHASKVPVLLEQSSQLLTFLQAKVLINLGEGRGKIFQGSVICTLESAGRLRPASVLYMARVSGERLSDPHVLGVK